MTAVRYMRVSRWYFAFDTCPVSKAQRCVWGHHIMVGAGARPLKQDYCIASDSHFIGEELRQSASAVGASRNCSPTCHSLYFFMMSESRISNFSTLKTGLILICWICIILLFTHVLRILCRDPQCKPSGLFVSRVQPVYVQQTLNQLSDCDVPVFNTLLKLYFTISFPNCIRTDRDIRAQMRRWLFTRWCSVSPNTETLWLNASIHMFLVFNEQRADDPQSQNDAHVCFFINAAQVHHTSSILYKELFKPTATSNMCCRLFEIRLRGTFMNS